MHTVAHERGAYGLSASVVSEGPSDAVHVRAVVVVLSIGFVSSQCVFWRVVLLPTNNLASGPVV